MWKPNLCGHQAFVFGKFSPRTRPVLCSPLSIEYMDQFVNQKFNVNLHLIGQHSHYLWLALAKLPPCQMPGPCGSPEVCQGGAGLLQYLYDKPVCLHEMAKGTFYLFIALLSATSNHSEELKYFYRSSWLIKFRGSSLCWIALSEVFNIFDKKYQRTFSSHQMPFHYSSFNKHSSLSKHDKSRVFWHIRVEDIYETENQNIVYCIWQGNFKHMLKTGMFCIKSLLLPFCSLFVC